MLLDVRNLEVRYGRVHAVRGVSLQVGAGEIVAILGANGAGKSSFLRAVLGIERVGGGAVRFDGVDITGIAPSARVRAGMVLVPEGRRVVRSLTVHENLLMGAFNRRDTTAVREEVESVYGWFPNLAARRHHPAAVLSGGEQQMLAIGRGLLAAPRLMMLDEPSLGLSPRLTDEVFACISGLRRARGLTILLVEQNTSRALAMADRAYVFELGRVVCAGSPQQVLAEGLLLDAYLGRDAVKGNPVDAQHRGN